MSCRATSIEMLRRPVGLTIAPQFRSLELIVVFLLASPMKGFRPQMTCVFILDSTMKDEKRALTWLDRIMSAPD
jgi:hypothetical protein